MVWSVWGRKERRDSTVNGIQLAFLLSNIDHE